MRYIYVLKWDGVVQGIYGTENRALTGSKEIMIHHIKGHKIGKELMKEFYHEKVIHGWILGCKPRKDLIMVKEELL